LEALAEAICDKLEDGTFAGQIPVCPGVGAFAETLRQCEDELHSTLEDWVLVGLKLGHPLPILAEIDLNWRPGYEPLEAVQAPGLHPTAANARVRWTVLGHATPVSGGRPQLRMMLREVEMILGREISLDEW
jgi:predicted RNase H-like HicB family nuclease